MKINCFNLIDSRTSLYSNNLDLPPKHTRFTFRDLKKGPQEFHRKFVLVPADKTANNAAVV